MQLDEAKIYQRIKRGDKYALKEVMDHYKGAFYAYVKNRFSSLDDTEREDAYTEAILRLYENILSGDFELQHTETLSGSTDQGSKMKAYIWNIAKNRLLNVIKKRQTHYEHEEKISTHLKILKTSDIDVHVAKEDRERVLAELMSRLPETYQEVLILKYYYNFSMDAIAKKMGFSGKDVAKATKYNAIKRLRTLANGVYDIEDLF